MNCMYCGYETREGESRFCPQCGNVLPQPTPQEEGAPNRLPAALRDKLFLVVCILISCSCLFSLSAQDFPLLETLFVIFLWITFAKAYKGTVSATHLRCISGTVFAEYVIIYVLSGICAVAGGFLLAAPSTVLIKYKVTVELPLISNNWMLMVTVIGLICLLASVVLVLFNVFGMRNIHAFAQSAYRHAQDPYIPLVAARTAKTWLYIIGVLDMLSQAGAIGSVAFFAAACNGLAAIFSAVLIGKYFS